MGEWSFEPKEVDKIKKGVILRGDWGYDQTNNEFCKVIKNTGKTLVCQRLRKIKIRQTSPGYGSIVMPDKDSKEFKPFRIKIDKYDIDGQPNVSLHGKMPFSDNKGDGTKVYWGRYDGGELIDTER
jgi:hypothetical protein